MIEDAIYEDAEETEVYWTCSACNNSYLSFPDDIPDAKRRHYELFHPGHPTQKKLLYY